jgi:hypothetical protein
MHVLALVAALELGIRDKGRIGRLFGRDEVFTGAEEFLQFPGPKKRQARMTFTGEAAGVNGGGLVVVGTLEVTEVVGFAVADGATGATGVEQAARPAGTTATASVRRNLPTRPSPASGRGEAGPISGPPRSWKL